MADFNDFILDLTNQAQQAGVQYDFGAKNPEAGSSDCSGWVSHLLNKSGIPISGTAAGLAEQAHKGGFLSSERSVGPGELVFGAGAKHATDRFGGIGHTGLTVQKGDQLYVSEMGSGGAKLTPCWLGRY